MGYRHRPDTAPKLRELAEFLRTVDEHRIDMITWARVGPEERETLSRRSPDRDEHVTSPRCCTTCCAVGWACEIFEELELRVSPGLTSHAHVALVSRESEATPPVTVAAGWGAVEEFFGITGRSAFYLFDEDWYDSDVTRDDVADRLEEFCRSLA